MGKGWTVGGNGELTIDADAEITLETNNVSVNLQDAGVKLLGLGEITMDADNQNICIYEYIFFNGIQSY